MANLNIKGINVASLTEEQKNAIASTLGISVDALTISVAQKKEINHLQMKDGSDNIAIDRFSGTEFDITQLTDEELTNAKKTGLSPESFNKMKEGEAIRALIKPLKGASSRGLRTGISAAQQIKDVVKQYIPKINESAMAILTDAAKSKSMMGIRYPLFIEIPNNATVEQKKAMRKEGNNNRFGAEEYIFPQIAGKSFFMTNDIYQRNIDRIISTIKNLAGTNDVKTDKVPKTKKSNKSKKNN